MLPAAQVEALTQNKEKDMFQCVFQILVDRLPGRPWVKTPQKKEHFGILW